jgi:cell division septum initiation protein DivIVA
MENKANELLQELREWVAKAKNVPMSASCMLNRSEVLEQLDRIEEAMADGMREAERVSATSLETLERAQLEAEQIVHAAEERVNFIAGESEVARIARQVAADLKDKSESDASALRRETDAFVDQRMATFEAALLSTLTQIRTMRDKLSDRSGLDDDEPDPLPPI